MTRPSLSICTIVRNENSQISGLLSNLEDFGDEIVIVDTGSVDGTKETILNHIRTHSTKKIKLLDYISEGGFHYGSAKNFSIQNATKDYVIILDADERLGSTFKSGVIDFIMQENPAVASVVRKDELLPHLIDYPERIIRRSSGIRYGIDDNSKVHEQLVHNVKAERFPGVVWHQQRQNHYVLRPQRILYQLELQIDRMPRTKSFVGHFVRGVWYFFYRFKKIYATRQLYKDGLLGFKYAFMRSLDAFLIELFVGLKPSKNLTFNSPNLFPHDQIDKKSANEGN